VQANKFSPDGKFLMVSIYAHGIYYYNVTSNYTHLGSIKSGFPDTNYYCYAMDFTPNGSNFIYSPLYSSKVNTLMLNMPALSSNRTISNTISSIHAIDIHPDGTQMIRCGQRAFEIVNLTTNATIHRVNDTSGS